MQKSYQKTAKEIKHELHLIDVEGRILGKVASEIAKFLIGKHKPSYTPNIDDGDGVVVINADKFIVTGNKLKQKTYFRHSGHPGSQKFETLEELLVRRPEEAIRRAVYNMLPKNKLRDPRMNRLKVYVGSEHPHTAQFPEKK